MNGGGSHGNKTGVTAFIVRAWHFLLSTEGAPLLCYNFTKQIVAMKETKPKIFQDPKTGRLMEQWGQRVRTHWTPYMLEQLKRDFPVTKTEELAAILNVSIGSVDYRAMKLGLKKSREYILSYKRKSGRLSGTIMASRSRFNRLTRKEYTHIERTLYGRWYRRRERVQKTYNQWLKEEYGIEDIKTISIEQLREKVKNTII